MKKVLYLMAVTLLTLSSCKKEDATSSQSKMTAQGPDKINESTSRRAVPFHVNFEESVEGFQIYNTCTDELMTLHGSIHDVFHGFYDGPDSKTTFHYNFQHSVSAVGASGREYTATGTLNAQEGEYSPGEFTFKYINKYSFITKGGGNNFIYELTHYLKVDDEGNWIVIRAEVEKSYCQ
jgi:hypothetical protein